MNRLPLSLALLAVTGLPQSAYATSEFEAFMKENTFDAQAASHKSFRTISMPTIENLWAF